MKASSSVAWSMRRSRATIPLRARTAVTAASRSPRAGDHDRRPGPLDAADLGQAGEQPVVELDRRPEADALLGIGPGDDAGRRVDRDDPALAEHGDPVGEVLGLLHEVGHEQDGHAAVADRLDDAPRLAAGVRIEARRQLVEDGDPRPPDERERDRQALLLAARQVAVGDVALVGEAEVLEQLASGPPARRRTRRTGRAPRAGSCARAARSPGAARRRGSGADPGRGAGRWPRTRDPSRRPAPAGPRSTRRSWSCRRRWGRGSRRSRLPRP